MRKKWKRKYGNITLESGPSLKKYNLCLIFCVRVCVCVEKKIKKIELCENKIATPLYAPGRCDIQGVVRSVA